MHRAVAKSLSASTKTAGAVLLAAALLAGCSAKPAEEPTAQAAEAQVKTVKVETIGKKKIGDPAEQVADVVSSLQLDVVTKTGGDIVEIVKKRGDAVTKGDVILRLDPTDVLLQKEKAQITIGGTQEQMAKARQDLADGKLELKNGIQKLESAIQDMEKTYNKMRNDYDLGLVTKIQLEQFETQLNAQKLDLESTRSKLKTLETTNSLSQLQQALDSSAISIREADRTLEHMVVTAPASGVLTELPIEVGMTVSAGFRAAQLQQLDPIKVKAELTEESAAAVRGKPELTFYIPGVVEPMKGKVSYLADVMSSQSKSYTLELEVPNADRKLRPGMKAQIRLAEEQDQNVIAVPTLAVVREGGDTFAFVLNGDQAEKRKIQLGRLNETYQEVLSGLKEGEQLIVFGQNQLKDKEKVQLAK